MEFEPSQFDSHIMPKHELILDINEATLELVNALRIQREAHIERSILTLDLEADGFVLPRFITRNLLPDTVVEEIILDAEINNLIDSARLDLRISALGESAVFMNVAAGEDDDEPRSSMLIDDMEVPCFEPATKVELNRFLASLFINNKTADYSAFDAMNVGKADVAQRLIEAIRDDVAEKVVEQTFFLGKTVGATTDVIQYVEHNDAPYSAVINVEHHAKASALDLSFTRDTMAVELDENDSDPEFLMQKLEGARTMTKDINGVTTPVESTNEFLIVIRDFLREKCVSVFVPPAESLKGDVADPSLEINIEDQRPNN